MGGKREFAYCDARATKFVSVLRDSEAEVVRLFELLGELRRDLSLSLVPFGFVDVFLRRERCEELSVGHVW